MTGPGSATCSQDGWGRENPTRTAPGEALTKRHRTGVQFPPSPPKESPRILAIRGFSHVRRGSRKGKIRRQSPEGQDPQEVPNPTRWIPVTPFTHGVLRQGLPAEESPLKSVSVQTGRSGGRRHAV